MSAPSHELRAARRLACASRIFAIAGLLVWLLVRQIREHESHLAQNLLELKQAKAKLLEEETLAAVGRLSSAIAHEIRNPVAMISSSLAMARRCPIDADQREGCAILPRARRPGWRS
jgi:C4-dicarboxylate-specific signal transduction histidine kinase